MLQLILLSLRRMLFPIISVVIFSMLIGTYFSLQAQSPNIVFILADDLGYGDMKVYNPASHIPTPHLNQLAAEGIKFTRAYCPVSVCSPSRYALMTGRYPWRSRNKSGVMANYEPSMIDSDILTLPEMLQQASYTTAGFGKWHLGTTFPTTDGNKPAGYGKFRADDNGANLDLRQPVIDGPCDHGFDQWYGFSCASECWIIEDTLVTAAIDHDLYTIEAATLPDPFPTYTLAEYLPHITDKAVAYLQAHVAEQNDQPFFLYFAPYVPHIPLAVEEAFQGKTEAGLYGDYVYELDHYIGKLLQALDSLGMKENTVILFASDNGSQFVLTSDKLDMVNAANRPQNQEDLQGLDGGHEPNWPFRGHKWSIYEGGVRTPFLARWPGHIPMDRTSAQMLTLNDMLATLAALVEYELPIDQAQDSDNLLPVFMGEDNSPIRNEVVVQSNKQLFAIIQGKWKYIGVGDYKSPTPESPPGELYDLSTDVSESNNLYDTYPQKVEELKALLRAKLAGDVELNK